MLFSEPIEFETLQIPADRFMSSHTCPWLHFFGVFVSNPLLALEDWIHPRPMVREMVLLFVRSRFEGR